MDSQEYSEDDGEEVGTLQQNDEDKQTKQISQNTTQIPEIALASIWYSVSDAATAAIATATLPDYNVVNPNNTTQVIDPGKVRQAKKNVMENCQEMANLKNQEEEIICIFFWWKEG